MRSTPTEVGEREGFVGIAVCAIAADGTVDVDEIKGLSGHLARLRMFKGADVEEVDFMLSRIARIGDEGGLQRLLEASTRAVSTPLREAAFAFGVDVVLSDRHVGERETEFLQRLRALLKVSEPTAAKILEVAQIRNRA